MNGHCIHQHEEWLSIIVKNPHFNSKPRFICNRDLGGIFIGYKAPSEPAYAFQPLVQIIPHFIPRLSTQKYSAQILLSIDHMQMYIFFIKVKEALFGARCWLKQAESSNFNGLQDSLIWKPDFMDPMDLFPSDAKVTCMCQQDCTYKYIWDGLKSNYVN